MIRNTGQPTFVTSINYDVTVSESTSVLSTLLQVRAVDSDDANTPNGQIRYSIVSPAVARSFFNIDPVSGNITSRLSLVSVPDDIYTVSSWGSNLLSTQYIVNDNDSIINNFIKISMCKTKIWHFLDFCSSQFRQPTWVSLLCPVRFPSPSESRGRVCLRLARTSTLLPSMRITL